MGKLKYNFNKVEFTYRNNQLNDYGFTSYQDFLKSEFWQVMKAKLKIKPYFKKCYCCGGEDRIELHHFKYKDIVDGSSAKNIAPTCRGCHEKIHQLSREKNYSFKSAARKIRKLFNYKPISVLKKIKEDKKERKTKYIIVTIDSRPCPKCRQPMQRRKHQEPPLGRAYFYKEWDYCRPCLHVQHYEEYKNGNF